MLLARPPLSMDRLFPCDAELCLQLALSPRLRLRGRMRQLGSADMNAESEGRVKALAARWAVAAGKMHLSVSLLALEA